MNKIMKKHKKMFHITILFPHLIFTQLVKIVSIDIFFQIFFLAHSTFVFNETFTGHYSGNSAGL